MYLSSLFFQISANTCGFRQWFYLTIEWIFIIISKPTGCGEVWYRAWFGSKRPRVRIPTLRPNIRNPQMWVPDIFCNTGRTRGLLAAIPERFPRSGERVGASASSSACTASGSNPDTPTNYPESANVGSGYFL